MSTLKLMLKNIGVFRGERHFEFSKGLNILYAPNASGKTSLITALKLVLVEQLAREEMAKALNDYEEHGLVRLIINNMEYSVKLTRQPNGNVEASGKRYTENDMVRKVAFIDMNNELVNAIYAGDQERVKSILKEVTGITYIETTLNALDSLKSEYEYEYQMKKREYESKKEVYIEYRKTIEERLEKVRDRIDEILRDPSIEHIRKEMEELEAERRSIEKEWSELIRERSRIDADVGRIKGEIRSKSASLDLLKGKRESIVKEVDELKRMSVEARRRIEIAYKELKSLEKKRTELVNEILENEKLIERRKSVLNYAICPYCGSPLDKDRIANEIAELEKKVLSLKNELMEVDEAIREKHAEVDELREKTEKELREREAKLREIDEEIEKLEKELSILNVRLEEREKEHKEISEKLKNLDEKLSLIIGKLERYKAEIPLVEELRYLVRERQKLYEELSQIDTRLRQLDELYSEVRILEDRLEKIKYLTEYFQIRLSELRHVAIEKINEIVLKHFKLLKLAELEYPIFSEDFTLTLIRAGGTPTTLIELSDAEKALLAILITLVLKDYVASDFPFYVIDTLVEFMDDTRAREVLKYLMEIAGDNIVVVSKTKPFTGELKLLTQEDIVVNKIPI